jgi:hypothetical protein
VDWSRFNLHGDAPTRAFESLTGIIFELWCRREYNSSLQQVIFVNGSGGDGGVEAYALLNNGDLIGLQAKWFREPLQDSQITQIKSSLTTAATVRPKLIRYIVTIPRDLGDVRRKSKTVTTERDRWNNFVSTARLEYPNIAIELWDETTLTSLLAELGSEGLTRFWFESSIVDLESLKLKLAQAQHGWLANRYYPLQHQCGQIQDDLNLRLNGTECFGDKWLQEVKKVLALLKKSQLNIQRLDRYQKVNNNPNATDIIFQVGESIGKAIAEQEELDRLLSNSYSFPAKLNSGKVDLDYSSIYQLIDILSEEDSNAEKGYNSTKKIREQLENTVECWNNREITPRLLNRLGCPVIYVGEPGIGKTHALVNTVEQHIQQNKPAILIRARDINLSYSWDKIIATAVGEPNWNLRQVCDALNASAVQSEVRAVNGKQSSPVRILIAIDGLDETTGAIKWGDKIGEIVPISQKYPRLLFVFSVRGSLFECINDRVDRGSNFDCQIIQDSDAPLDKIFESYCQLNHIHCSSLVRWALQTPFAIQLFAELYKGQSIHNVVFEDFSLVKLISKKIDRIEIEIRDKNNFPNGITPVRNSLRAIARNCLNRVEGIPEEEILEIVEQSQKPSSILSRPQLLDILNQCSDRGLLLKRTQYNIEDLLDGDTYTWDLASQSITDFLLACEAFFSVKDNSDKYLNLPPYLEKYPDAVLLSINLISETGFDFYNSKLWADSIHSKRRENIQLTVLSMIATNHSVKYLDWVKELFIHDMPTCQEILRRLVEPCLRIPNHPYGANFVHETLLPLSVADRDLFWSGPYYIPHNHGAKWEGTARNPVLETLDLADDDKWDSAPLLLAWATTTVNNGNRRRIRSSIARWGHDKPSELLKLIEKALETNDPQMREDMMLSAYGAACLVRPDETWLDLCNWIVDFFFKPDSIGDARNAIVRHCATSIIMRCSICGVSIPEQQQNYVNNFTIDSNKLLQIDRDAALNVRDHGGYPPIDDDLAWYVVPNAVETFFNSIKDFIFNPKPHTSAQAFIKKYAKYYNSPDLNPRQFTFGFIREYINQLGWSEDIFYGSPNGGKDGEILGADIAILRKHHQASHGERSSISTFAEKYVWIATHELIGILATCLPAYDDSDRPFDLPVSLSLLVEINNPATDLRQPELDEDDLIIPFPDLSPDAPLLSELQIDRSNEWVTKAPLPPIESLIQIDPACLPECAKHYEWLALQSFANFTNDDSQSISALWTSCFTISKRHLSTLRNGIVEENTCWDIHKFQGGIRSAEFYQDPSEVVWAKWIQDIECDRDLIIQDISGKNRKIAAKATSCKFHWQNSEAEVEEWIPTSNLCQHLKIVDFQNGRFINDAGDIVCLSLKQDTKENSFHTLVIRKDIMDEYLKKNKLAIVWGVRIFREPSSTFAMLSEQGQRMFRDYKSIVIRSKTGLETIHHNDVIQAWGAKEIDVD